MYKNFLTIAKQRNTSINQENLLKWRKRFIKYIEEKQRNTVQTLKIKRRRNEIRHKFSEEIIRKIFEDNRRTDMRDYILNFIPKINESIFKNYFRHWERNLIRKSEEIKKKFGCLN